MTTASRTARGLGLTILAIAAAGLAACGGDSGSSASSGSAGGGYGGKAPAKTTAAASTGGGATVALAADETSGLAFDKQTATAKSGKVTLTLTNAPGNSAPHAIAIEGQGIDKDGQTASPGGASSVSVDLKPGTYTFYCPVGGHRAAGMEGTLTVG
jgi:plastocyanin